MTAAVANCWCILRTSGPKTLPLARSLAEAGLGAWTPTEPKHKRKSNSKAKVRFEVPITPTFVFVPADRLGELVWIRSLPVSPHPSFSIFKYAGRVPLISAVQMNSLHGEERICQEQFAIEEAAEQRRVEAEKANDLKRLLQRERARLFAPGTIVRAENKGFEGFTGIVESGDGKKAWVVFGGNLRVQVGTWLLSEDDVHSTVVPMDTAA